MGHQIPGATDAQIVLRRGARCTQGILGGQTTVLDMQLNFARYGADESDPVRIRTPLARANGPRSDEGRRGSRLHCRTSTESDTELGQNPGAVDVHRPRPMSCQPWRPRPLAEGVRRNLARHGQARDGPGDVKHWPGARNTRLAGLGARLLGRFRDRRDRGRGPSRPHGPFMHLGAALGLSAGQPLWNLNLRLVDLA